MAKRRFLVTGALPYSNGKLHVGHIAGAYLPADIFVRYLRARGDEVLFICGSDDHGVPVCLTARQEGSTPAEVVARYNACQHEAFDGIGIHFDIYGRTSSPKHHQLSSEFFLKVHDQGAITKKKSEQLYDPQAGMFLPDRYVKGICHHCDAPDALGDQCEACGKTIDPLLLKDPVSVITGTKPEVRSTTHWFFQQSQFEERLHEWLEGHSEWRPFVRNFAQGLVKQGLPDRAITRDLDWGVPVPLRDDPDAEGKVLYVWFDAPIGYVSFTAEWCAQQGMSPDAYAQWWKDPDCQIVHFIGEDNIVFHAIIWPAMLMAEGSFQLPTNVVANSFLNIQLPGRPVEKISKSRGTAIWIDNYLKDYHPDLLRYYLTAIASETQRTTFSLEEMVTRVNSELVDALGNFIHRTLSFNMRYFDGKIPEKGNPTETDLAHWTEIQALPERLAHEIESFRFRNALNELMSATRASNKYIDTKAPWKQRKEDLAGCATTMYYCIQTTKALAVLMNPFLPFTSEKTLQTLGLDPKMLNWDRATEPMPEGAPLLPPEIPFKKMELPEDLSRLSQSE